MMGQQQGTNLSDAQKDRILDTLISQIERKDDPERWENCPENIPRNCIYRSDDADKDNRYEICERAPCELTRFHHANNERIIQYYIRKGMFDDAYYFLQRIFGIMHLSCNLEKLEKYDPTDPNYKKRIPIECRVFILNDELKEKLDEIYELEQKCKKGDVSKTTKDALNNTKTRFRKKMNSIISILKHLAQDRQTEEAEKQEAHRKILEKLLAMAAANAQYTGTFGEEVDESTKEQERRLRNDHPKLKKDMGLFEKERKIRMNQQQGEN
jgi:hypothetical protein